MTPVNAALHHTGQAARIDRQYQAAEPEYRLVPRTLEQRWEKGFEQRRCRSTKNWTAARSSRNSSGSSWRTVARTSST